MTATIFPQMIDGSLEDDCAALKVIVRDLIEIIKDMRCQRACYVMESSTKAGDVWDAAAMDDFKNTTDDMEDGQRASVAAVIAKGIVKKDTRGQQGPGKVIIKPKVLLGIRHANGAEN